MRNRYNYVFDELTNTYNFTTKNDILYRVAFVVDHTFSTISGEEMLHVYQLIVEKATEEKEPLDIKVSWTIGDIVERFFHNIKNSLIYICSDTDNRASIRLDTFERWYRNSKAKEVIIKLDKVINIEINKEQHKLYTVFLFHRMNPNFKRLKEIYNQLEEFLNQDK